MSTRRQNQVVQKDTGHGGFTGAAGSFTTILFKWLLIGSQAETTRAPLTLAYGKRWPHQGYRSGCFNVVPREMCPPTQVKRKMSFFSSKKELCDT